MVELALRHVGVTLGGRKIVRDVSARFRSGTLIGIIGPNGAGKSTLVRAILGLVRATGTVALDGTPIARIPAPARAKRIAYLPQGQTLHWPLSVERLVALGRLPYLGPFSHPGPADRAAIRAAMERTRVLPLRDRDATTLSGGERARVMLARALAVGADALVADEPLLSLDPGHQLDVMDLLQQEALSGTLVLAVLHDLTHAARYCDRLLVIGEGRVVADGPPDAVLTEELLARVYGIRAVRATAGPFPIIIPVGRAENGPGRQPRQGS